MEEVDRKQNERIRKFVIIARTCIEDDGCHLSHFSRHSSCTYYFCSAALMLRDTSNASVTNRQSSPEASVFLYHSVLSFFSPPLFLRPLFLSVSVSVLSFSLSLSPTLYLSLCFSLSLFPSFVQSLFFLYLYFLLPLSLCRPSAYHSLSLHLPLSLSLSLSLYLSLSTSLCLPVCLFFLTLVLRN